MSGCEYRLYAVHRGRLVGFTPVRVSPVNGAMAEAEGFYNGARVRVFIPVSFPCVKRNVMRVVEEELERAERALREMS